MPTCRCIVLALLLVVTCQRDASAHDALPATRTVEQTLIDAGENRAELERALREIEDAFRPGMTFLITYMPPTDAATLDADFLLTNVRQAYEARARVPWGDRVPDEIFFNDVLPYASVSEPREAWRESLMEQFLEHVTECATPAEAAQRLNRVIFPALGVRYSTKRARADQSPSESIAQGMASCTGLSILLTNGCRATCIPARLAGIPEWPHKGGNHTWVEVWSDGTWYFTGAAEPSDQGLNHAWFNGDAARADVNSRAHSIYATSWQHTGVTMPMVWAADADPVPAVNVTSRYTGQDETTADDTAQCYVRVVHAETGARIATTVHLTYDMMDSAVLADRSRDETFDLNDMATFDVPLGAAATIILPDYPDVLSTTVSIDTPTRTVTITVPREPDDAETVQALQRIASDLRGAFHNELWGTGVRPPFQGAEHVLNTHEDAVRALVWSEYQSAPIHFPFHKDFNADRVRIGHAQ
ncbi:MAG: transglutaminase family protein, partial [Planctomycetota bacterium]